MTLRSFREEYQKEIKEIHNLMQQLIDKHPENEDRYRDFYDSFMKVLNESIKTDNGKTQSKIGRAS